jgi:hypothetical protein
MTTRSICERSVRAAMALARDRRGVALPMALMTLVILSALIGAFLVLSAVEPTIANNQLAVAQARALAEAGVERALWALSNPNDAQGIPVSFTTPPAPYDGGQLVSVATGGHAVGGFRVTVTNGSAPYERRIRSSGFVPGDASARRAVQVIEVTALNPQLIVKDPPAAVSARGPLRASGNVRVDGKTDRSCGLKVGTLTRGETAIANALPDIRGGVGDGTARNRVTDAAGGAIPPLPGDIVKNTSSEVFDGIQLTDADIDALRALARARGTYLRGAVTFGAGRRMPNGLIFVDTVSGENVAAGGDPGDLASVSIEAGAPDDPSGVWSGWLIVNGSVALGGDARLKGFVYAQNAVTAAGRTELRGAAVSRNVRDGDASILETDAGGAVSLVYDCREARTGGEQIPGRWSIKAGAYREVSG